MALGKAFVTISLIVNFCFVSSKLSCRNDKSDTVDWFIAMKFPSSYSFVYLSSDMSERTWQMSKFGVDDEESLIGRTIVQSYFRTTESFFAYYNDGTTLTRDSGRGHLKGVINFDKTSGYWLVHSVPAFPVFGEYYYPKPGRKFGQSFICVTLSTTNLADIARQLIMMQATVYNHSLPEDFEFSAILNSLVQNENLPIENEKFTLTMNTVKGKPLHHFGKSKEFQQDLYSDLVAPGLKSSIYVESWIRGQEIPSSCRLRYQVLNVRKVKLPGDEVFIKTRDHSKWVVPLRGNKKFVCIGDINRMKSQFKRGGGTLCIVDDEIYAQFLPIVNDSDKCKIRRPIWDMMNLL